MKSDDELFEISDEFTKSLEKLVEEETNVAKAYVKENDISITAEQAEVVDMGSTQMFDSDELKKNVGGIDIGDLLDDEDDDFGTGATKRSAASTDRNSARNIARSEERRADTKKNMLLLCAVVAVVLVGVVGIIVAAIAMSNNTKNSYAYNMEQAKNYYESGDYGTALNYYNVAYGTVEGKKDTNLMLKMYECYKNNNDSVMAKSMLDDIIAYDKYNETAIKELAKNYKQNQDGAALNSMIVQYRGTRAEDYMKEFEVAVPTPSETPGEFSSSVKLSLLAGSGCNIYYTVDGSEPTTASNMYTGELLIDKNVVVKAIAVDNIGVESAVAAFEYKINYVVPTGPVLNVATGATIDTDTVLEITNLKPGDNAYYTTDGTTPTAKSTKYDTEKGIQLDKGSCIVSLVIISATGDASKITRYTYVVNAVKIYTYEECVKILKQRMITLNILQSDGYKTTGGDKVSFLYDSKQYIDEKEMYIVRYVVKPTDGKETEGYYGVSTKGGNCYKVTIKDNQYSAVKY